MTAAIPPDRAPRVMLVWDAPNMDMSLGSLLGARPTAAFRPRFDAVGRWLLELAGPDATAALAVDGGCERRTPNAGRSPFVVRRSSFSRTALAG